MKRILQFFILLVLVTSNGCAQDIELTLEKRSGDEKIFVDKDIKELHFYKDNLISIKGLENLNKLEKITFEMTSSIKDFSFLNDVELSILVFQDCNLEKIDFVYEQIKLKELVIQGCQLVASIDAEHLVSLEYLEITNSGITNFIQASSVPSSLKILNLAYNKISYINSGVLSNLSDVDLIILTGNPITIESNNIVMDSLGKVLPDVYKKYLR